MKGKIKELTELQDFKKVYMVFSGPPYYDSYTNEALDEIFREYQEKGYIYGAYNGDECVGLIAIERGAKPDHPVEFKKGRIMYLADVAVLEEYRKKGIGNSLMIYGVMQSKALGYDTLYMRTLKDGSMSYSIASKIGFKQIPNVYQSVAVEKTNGKVEAMQNMFLQIDLNNLNKDNLKQGINMTSPTLNKGIEMGD